MIGCKVRITEELIDWYFSNEAYECYQLEAEDDYDLMIVSMLEMLMSKNSYPGEISHFAASGNYWVIFPNGYRSYFEPKNLIVKKRK